MSFAEKSIGVFTTRIAVILVTFVSGVIVTRILGPTYRGVLDLLVLLPQIVISLGHLGIGNANLYFIAKDKKPIEEIVSNSLSVSIVLGIILIFISYLAFFAFRETIFSGAAFEYTIMVFVTIPFILFQKYSQYVLLGKEEIGARNAVVLYPVLFNFVLIIILMVLIKFELMGIIIAKFATHIIAFILCLYLINKRAAIRWAFDFKLFLESLKFGIVPFLALMIMNLNFRADLFLIKYYMDNTAVGLYSLAVSLVEKIGLLPEAIGLVLFARIANVSESEANELTSRICRFSLFISILGGLGLLLISRHAVIFLYGEAFSASVQPLMILIPGIVFLQLFVVLHSDLTARGRAIVTLYIFAGALVLNIILNLFWIPRYEINGAAAASSVSYSAGAIILVLTFSRLQQIDLESLLVINRRDFSDYAFPLVQRLLTRLVGKRTV